MFKLILGGIALLIVGSIALDNPDETTRKIQSTGDIVGSVIQEGGNVLNEGVDGLSNIGEGGGSAPTTAPPAGSGRS